MVCVCVVCVCVCVCVFVCLCVYDYVFVCVCLCVFRSCYLVGENHHLGRYLGKKLCTFFKL